MTFPLGLVLSELDFEYEFWTEDSVNPMLEGAELLADGGANLRGRRLFVCPLSEALLLSEECRDACYFLCLRDRIVDESETPEKMKRIIVVKRNIGLRELYNRVQELLSRLNNWIIDMQRAVLMNRGIQHLLDISEDIIGNPITILNATFRLIAYTKNIKTDDRATNALIANGAHPPETVRRFQEIRRIEEFEKASGLVVSDDQAISDCTVVKKVFRYEKDYTAIAVLVCSERPLSEGLKYLFSTLMEYIELYVERTPQRELTGTVVEHLLCDILDGKLSHANIRDRVSYAGIPYKSNFELYKLVWKDKSNVPAHRNAQELKDRLPGCWVFLYGKSFLILRDLSKNEGREGDDFPGKAVGNLVRHCAVSNPFSNLGQLPAALRQCDAAIRTQKQSLGALPHRRFEELALHHLVGQSIAYTPELYQGSFFARAAGTLLSYDEHHNTELAKVLRVYLDCDRRATEACKRLHIHRNTVVYHIDKIQELLGVNLDDPDVRIKLSLMFRMLEMKEARHVFGLDERHDAGPLGYLEAAGGEHGKTGAG